MGAGDRREDGDDHEQHRAGRKRVAEQRDGPVSASKLRRHDAGADHRHHQNEGAECFRRQAAGQIELHSPLPVTRHQQQGLLDFAGAASKLANGSDVPQPGKIP